MQTPGLLTEENGQGGGWGGGLGRRGMGGGGTRGQDHFCLGLCRLRDSVLLAGSVTGPWQWRRSSARIWYPPDFEETLRTRSAPLEIQILPGRTQYTVVCSSSTVKST